jgi:NitT/TauT family transport system ATP-binding protein
MFSYTLGDPLVTVDNVSVTLDNTLILSGVSATIPNIKRSDNAAQGQIVCLVGPSGCGKTTLFRTISGMQSPDVGTVTLSNGKPVEAGQVGVVAQNYPLLEHRTVMNNLIFAGRMADMKKADAKRVATEYLTDFNLSEHADKYPFQLSGGQRQRVAIAQQLICSEHFIILDEPFSGLDEVAKTKVIKLLIKVANKHDDNTLIIITHDVTAAVAIADMIWLMGRDRDAEGKVIPGARIMEMINLIDMGIAWYDDPTTRPGATELIRNIKQALHTL